MSSNSFIISDSNMLQLRGESHCVDASWVSKDEDVDSVSCLSIWSSFSSMSEFGEERGPHEPYHLQASPAEIAEKTSLMNPQVIDIANDCFENTISPQEEFEDIFLIDEVSSWGGDDNGNLLRSFDCDYEKEEPQRDVILGMLIEVPSCSMGNKDEDIDTRENNILYGSQQKRELVDDDRDTTDEIVTTPLHLDNSLFRSLALASSRSVDQTSVESSPIPSPCVRVSSTPVKRKRVEGANYINPECEPEGSFEKDNNCHACSPRRWQTAKSSSSKKACIADPSYLPCNHRKSVTFE